MSNSGYGYDKLQIKNLFSIRRHSYAITIINNTFQANSVIKGLIYIDSSFIPSTIEIRGNVFNHNFAYLATSAIYIRRDVVDFHYQVPWPGNN